jgi:hypothetical protein
MTRRILGFALLFVLSSTMGHAGDYVRHWIREPGCARAIADGYDTQWAIGCGTGADSGIYRRPLASGGGFLNATGPWVQVPGWANKISAGWWQGGTDPWVVNSAGNIYRWNGSSWDLKPGCAVDIGGGGDNVWVIGCGSPSIYQWDNDLQTWISLGGLATGITADLYGPHVIGLDGGVWDWTAATGWTTRGGWISAISDSVYFPEVAGVGGDNGIWVLGTAGWERRRDAPSSLPIVALADNFYAVDSSGAIYYAAIGAEPLTLYRGYGTNDHFLTVDRNEIVNAGYTVDGPVGKCWPAGSTNDFIADFQRLYNAPWSDHLYTTNASEVWYVLNNLPYWVPEKTPCAIYQHPVTVDNQLLQPLHRFFNSVGSEHLYSTDQGEINRLCQGIGGWTYEGIAGYLLAPASSVPASCGKGTIAPPPIPAPPACSVVVVAHTTTCYNALDGTSTILSQCAVGCGKDIDQASAWATASLSTQVCLGSAPGCCEINVDQNFNVCGE